MIRKIIRPLLQEIYQDDGWKMLVCCMLVNLTDRRQVDTIREKNPNTPILFVDLFKSSISILNEKTKIDEKAMNDALKAQFNRMLNLGYKNIHYLETPNIIDTDNNIIIIF